MPRRFPSLNKRTLAWLGMVLASAVLLRYLPSSSPRTPYLPDGPYRVETALDGDTITLPDGRRIRFVSIDAPEMNYKHPPAEPFAEEAREAVMEMLSRSGWKVRLERCGPDRDRYGRFLRHAFAERNGGEVLIEEELVRMGLAEVKDYGGGCPHLPMLRRAEAEAKKAGRGIWSTVKAQ